MSDEDRLFIGDALKQIAAEEGITQAELARRVEVDVRHLTNLWNNKRPTGVATALAIARKMGKSLAFMAGEEGARPQIGTVDAFGLVTMTAASFDGTLLFVDACPPFESGTRLIVKPQKDYAIGRWLVIRQRAGQRLWLAFAENRSGLQVLRRAGEAVIFEPSAHEVLGAITDMIVAPPKP